MSCGGHHVVKYSRIPQPIATVQTAFVSSRLRPFYKQLTPSKAIFESKKFKSACSFLKQLKEKLESDDSMTELEQRNDAFVDIINTLFDVNDVITPILNNVSSDYVPLQKESVFLAKEFDDAMSAASKIYEVTKQIKEEAASEENVCYFSKQIIASNYEQINMLKENLSTIGDRIYVDRELVKQLADLQILLKDTIWKLKEKEEQLKNSRSELELKLVKHSKSGCSVKIDPSTQLAPETPRESFLSGDARLSREFSSSNYVFLEEIKAKPENETYFVKCAEYLDLLKTCLQQVMVGDTCEYGELKVYKDKRPHSFDELRVYVDGTPLIIRITRMRQNSKLSTGEIKDKKEPKEKLPVEENTKVTSDQRLESTSGIRRLERKEPVPDKAKEKFAPVEEPILDKKDAIIPKQNKVISTPDKAKPGICRPSSGICKLERKKPVPDKSKEKSFDKKDAITPKQYKAISTPDKPKPDKKKKLPSYCCKKKKDTKQYHIPEQVSRPDIPYTAEKSSLPILADEQVCASRDLDVKYQNSTLRQFGINHPDANVVNTLKQIPVEYLLMSCRPAKCCRKAVLNGKPHGKYPYAASLRSLPLMQKDLDKVQELVQSNQHFLDSCTTFDAYVNFQKNSNEKLLYFCNAPASTEVRFFEIFRREFSKTSLYRTKATQSNYGIRILGFLRQFYSREPLPPQNIAKTEKTLKKRSKKNKSSKQRARSRSKKKSTLKAKLTPQFSFSSSSFIGNRFTVSSKKEKGKTSFSALLVPETEVTSYISEEIITTKHTKKHQLVKEREETTTSSNNLEDVKTEPDSQAALDVSSLSPANYAETLNVIYELDEDGNIRAKTKSCPHTVETITQHQDDPVEFDHESHLRLHKTQNHLQINIDKSQDVIFPVTTESHKIRSNSKQTSMNVNRLYKYKLSASNAIDPEVSETVEIRSGPERIPKTVEPNLSTIYEVEESKRTVADDDICQHRCDMCQKLKVQNFSNKSIISYNHQSKASASESSDSITRMRLIGESRKQQTLVNTGTNTSGLFQSNSSEKATLLQMNLNEIIQKLNYQNIYRVKTNHTQTLGQYSDIIPSGPIFETTALTHTKEISVQTSQSDLVESNIAMYLGPTTQTQDSVELFPPRIVSKRSKVVTGNIREDMIEMKHKKTKSIFHQVKLNTSYVVQNRRSSDRIQIEKNVLTYVINPKKMKNIKHQTNPKYFPSDTRGSSANSSKRIRFHSVSNLKRVNHNNMESKCEMVCSWPPKQAQAVRETKRKALFISVHGSDGEDAYQKQDKLLMKSSTEENNGDSPRSDVIGAGLQRKVVERPKTERLRRTKRQPIQSFSNQNYVVGFMGPDNGEGEKKAPKCNHRHRKEKLKRKKLRRIPEVIDVTISKHVKRNVLEFRAVNEQNIPGFVTVLSTPCDCPDITIFIPCFCGNYKCDRCKVSRITKNKIMNYTKVPFTNRDSVYSFE